jgi:hypothetical protein
MLFKVHLRRAKLSKAYAIQPVVDGFRIPTINSVAIIATGRFCNSKWAFLNVLQRSGSLRRNNRTVEFDARASFDGAGVQSSAMEFI